MIPAKKIPMFCNTIGTGINGKGTPGTNPKMQIMAVIKAVKLNSLYSLVHPPYMRMIITPM